MAYSAREIAEKIGAEVVGDGSVELTGLAGIEDAHPGELAFVANRKYLRYLATTHASAVITEADVHSEQLTLLVHPDPYFAFMKAIRIFHPPKEYSPGIHATAVIAESARVDPSAHIGPNVVIEDSVTVGKRSAVLANVFVGEEVEIGDECLIYPNVTIREQSIIGDRVIVHSGTVIGSDGFGYASADGKHHKILQVGHVAIEDDVEIGANVTIDRATLGVTRIGRGTKIDNLVQIGHNVDIEEGCIIISQTGVSGSTRLGKYVILAGQVGLVGHIEIGDGAIVGAQSGVSKSVMAGKTVSGSPAREIMHARKIDACLSKLPESIKLLKQLDKKIVKLTESED